MKILNLYFTPSDVRLSQMGVPVKNGISDKQFLEREIREWLGSRERRRQLDGEAYLDGDHSILRRKRTAIGNNGDLVEVKNLPNNRIVDNQYEKAVQQKTNYLLGKPITFDAKNKAYAEALTRLFNRRKQRTLKILCEDAIVGGKAWLFPYYTDNGEFTFTVFPAHEILPFWADAEHTLLDCAVHLFPVYVYDDNMEREVVLKAEVMHGAGIDRFVYENGILVPDNDAPSGSYITVTDGKTGKTVPYNWQKIPLICFKFNHREQPLICRVKCLQDALNLVESNFINAMEEDARNTVLVLHNLDGEDLGEFRRNLATYGAIKVRSWEGKDGKVDKLEIDVNVENYKTMIDLLKKSIIENAKAYDAKDDRMSNNPNQMNIQSMYSDIDLDANGMETGRTLHG